MARRSRIHVLYPWGTNAAHAKKDGDDPPSRACKLGGGLGFRVLVPTVRIIHRIVVYKEDLSLRGIPRSE